jgi:hypothetical protein
MLCESRRWREQGFATLVLPPFHQFESDLPAELPTAYTGGISVRVESEYDVTELPYALYHSRPGSDHSIALVWCQDGDADARKVVQDVRIAGSATKNAIKAVGVPTGVRHVNLRKVKAERNRLGEKKEFSESERR